MATQLLVQNYVFGKLSSSEVLPENPSWILPPFRQQLLLFIAHYIQPSILVKIRDRQRVQRPVLEALRQFLLFPTFPLSVRTAQYNQFGFSNVGIAHHNRLLATGIDVNYSRANTNAERALASHRYVFMNNPLASFPLILEPHIGANDV